MESISPQTSSRVIVADRTKDHSEVKVHNIRCPPLVHRASRCLLEGKQIVQAWFTLVRSLLAFPHHLLIHHLLRNGFQEDFFNSPLRDWSLTDWPVAPKSLWIPFFKMGMTFDFLQYWEPSPITMTFYWVAIKYDCANSKVCEPEFMSEFCQNYTAEGQQQMEQLLLGCCFHQEEMSGRSRKGELWRA